MRIFFKNGFYNLPHTEFLLKYSQKKFQTPLVRNFFEMYRESKTLVKPEIYLEEVFKNYPSIELKQLQFFSFKDTKEEFFNSLLPKIHQKEVPRDLQEILCSYQYSEPEVLSQIEQVSGKKLSQIEYGSWEINYFSHGGHKQDYDWLKSILEILIRNKTNSLEEKFYILNGLCIYSDVQVDKSIVAEKIKGYPNYPTVEENLFYFILARNAKIIDQKIIDKVVAFTQTLPDYLQYCLDLSNIRYVCEAGSQQNIKKYLEKVPMEYFAVSTLARHIDLKGEIYRKHILPLAEENFYLFHSFFDKEDLRKHTPLGIYISSGLRALQNENWKYSLMFADFLSSDTFSYKLQKNQFFLKTIKPQFLNANNETRCRMLPLLVRFDAQGELYESVTSLPLGRLSEKALSLLFYYFNTVSILMSPSGKKARVVLEVLLQVHEEQSQLKKKDASYENLHLSFTGNNFVKFGFLNTSEVADFLKANKSYFLKNSYKNNFRSMFCSLNEYYQFISKIFDKKVADDHIYNVTMIPHIKDETSEWGDVKELLKLAGEGLLIAPYKLQTISDLSGQDATIRDLLSKIPSHKKDFEINQNFLKDLNNFQVHDF